MAEPLTDLYLNRNYSNITLVEQIHLFLIHEFTFEILLPVLPTEFYMVSFTDWHVLVNIFMIYIVLTTLLKLSKSWYRLQQVEKEKVEIELKSLKMQVNPHFLFNTLNSIYSLALAKHDKAGPAVLELSNLMRYMLYEVADKQVDLEKEVEMINNYLDLQKLRADDSTDIQFEIEGDPKSKTIAPLLFFPLIENSFKHGVKGVSDSAFVHMKLICAAVQIEFHISNNKGAMGFYPHYTKIRHKCGEWIISNLWFSSRNRADQC